MARNNIELKLIRGNHVAAKTPAPDFKRHKELVAMGAEVEEEINPALVISLVDHPVVIQYGEFEIRLSPRARVRVADHGKLDKDNLPKSVALKPLPAKVAPKIEEDKSSEKKKSTRKKVAKKKD